jgi:membrane fusion protein, multidrug efflux system
MRLTQDGSTTSSEQSNWKREVLLIIKSKYGKIFFAVFASIIVLRLGINWILHSKHTINALRVEIVQPEAGKMEQSLNLPGNVEAIERANIHSHVSGFLKKIYVDEGDHVREGQLLAEIDAPDVLQDYNRAKAEYSLKEATRKRYDLLFQKRLISQQEFENFTADADESKARFDYASANLAFTRITAPFSGSIARRFLYPGDLISMNSRTVNDQPIFVLVNERKLRVSVNVPQIDVANIHLEDHVDVKVDAFPDRSFQGKISRIDAMLDDNTKTQRVLIDLKNPDNALHSGMFASVNLYTVQIDKALSLPSNCLRDENGKHYAFVEKDHKAHKVEVKTGLSLDGKIQITEGIQPDDHVIRIGSTTIGDGDAVLPAQ